MKKKELLTKMFDEIFSVFFRPTTLHTKNSHFGFILNFLIEVMKSINTNEEFMIFCCEWQRIEKVISELYGPSPGNLHQKEFLNNRISFLLSLFKKHPEKLLNRKGFKPFYEKEYRNFFQECLELKQIDDQSKITPKRKRSSRKSFGINLFIV